MDTEDKVFAVGMWLVVICALALLFVALYIFIYELIIKSHWLFKVWCGMFVFGSGLILWSISTSKTMKGR